MGNSCCHTRFSDILKTFFPFLGGDHHPTDETVQQGAGGSPLLTCEKCHQKTKKKKKKKKKERIKELEGVVFALRKDNENLRYRLEEDSGHTRKSMVSMEHLEMHAEQLLEDPETNIAWLPDAVEKRIYINVLRLVMQSLATTLDTMKIQLLNHEIIPHLQPVSSFCPSSSVITMTDNEEEDDDDDESSFEGFLPV